MLIEHLRSPALQNQQYADYRCMTKNKKKGKVKIMQEIIVGVEGMMCGKCEAHTNKAVENAFKVEKVTSDHDKNQTVIITGEEISDEKITEVITEAGYKVTGIERKPYEKKGIFQAFRK